MPSSLSPAAAAAIVMRHRLHHMTRRNDMSLHRRLTALTILLTLVFALALPASASAADAPAVGDASMLAVAVDLYRSLTDAQRQAAVLPFDSPERSSEVFTPGRRAGIPLRELTEAQRTLAHVLLKKFTSEYGAAKAEAVAAQGDANG